MQCHRLPLSPRISQSETTTYRALVHRQEQIVGKMEKNVTCDGHEKNLLIYDTSSVLRGKEFATFVEIDRGKEGKTRK